MADVRVDKRCPQAFCNERFHNISCEGGLAGIRCAQKKDCALLHVQDTEQPVPFRLREDLHGTLYHLYQGIDPQSILIDFNRTAHERLGYIRNEMLSMKINELDPPEFASRVPARLAQIQEHGQAVFESAHVKKDGSKMPVGVNSRILDYKGMRVYFSVIRDITERKKAEEAKDRLLNAISASTKGIAITDEQRQVHLCK